MTALVIRCLAFFGGLYLCDRLHRRWLGGPQHPGWRSLWIVIILLLIAGGWFAAIRECQLRPHVVTTTLGNKVLTSCVVTNPAYVTFETKMRLGSNGVEYYQAPKTNYYWTVWSIFKR